MNLSQGKLNTMYQAIANFSYQHFEQDPVTLISRIIEQWRNNGQIIGREFGVTLHKDHFQARLSLPEQESLLPKWNSEWVDLVQQEAEEYGVCFESFEIIGQDYQADETASVANQNMLILYTTHLDSCSPIKTFDEKTQSLKPVPLYRILKESPELSEALVKWQEDWQACDQLQMNGHVLEAQALAEISHVDSVLTQTGRRLAKAIEEVNQTPVYYYLYRLGKDTKVEHERKCPSCGSTWKLVEPIAEILHFKCDSCRLVSNLSWEIL